jgi:CTP synthase
MKKPKPAAKPKKDSTKKSNSAEHHKYIFVVGGVMSGVGKGIATSSIGTLLQARGFAVNLVKVDPYLNVDAGTMNPTEHGEVFVLDSGLETDQDMGNYERFLHRTLSPADYLTSGIVYKTVIERERALGYGGKCVEAVPHVRDEIVKRFEDAAAHNNSDISIIEIGGTVGDYQNIMFIEAARALKIKRPNDVIFVMVSYLPIPNKIGEMKSRPTQHAVNQLASYGVYTDIIIARSELPVDKKRKEKIAVACNINPDHVISAPDIDSIYDVPLNFKRDKLADIVLSTLHIEGKHKGPGLGAWKAFAEAVKDGKRQVVIGVVGKYFSTGDFVLSDAYISVLEAIKYAARTAGVQPVIRTINARDFEEKKVAAEAMASLQACDGIIVPGGFGESGIEGKLAVIRYAREQGVPYFGLCYGMQLMTIEYARNVLGLEGAHTAEINPKAPHVIIDIMPEQKTKLAEKNYGGSMRLGAYPTVLTAGTVAYGAYADAVKAKTFAGKAVTGKEFTIYERHRHRYEVSPAYIPQLTEAGLVFSGTSPDGRLMEIAELPVAKHPFFVGAQFHPEFLARPLMPHPLFVKFMQAAAKQEGLKKAPK